MLSRSKQANNIWEVYNQQEKHNKYWELLFIYLYLHCRTAFKKRDIYNKQKKRVQIRKLTKDFDAKMSTDSEKISTYIEEHLKDTYKKTWAATCKNLEKDFNLPSEEDIYKNINKTWVGEKNFKERQEHNTNLIIKKLKKVLEDDTLSVAEKEKLAQKYIQEYKNMVKRLVRTETIHTIGQASISCMQYAGVDEVIWITCMDEKTCRICGARDNHIYPIDMIPQYPDHPNCRCLLIAHN